MRPSLRSLFEQIVNSPIEQSEEHSSSNEENDNNGSVKSVGHVPGNLAAMVRTQKKNMTVDTKDKSQTSSKPKKPDSKAQTTPPGNINSLKKRNKRKNSEKERKKETPSPKDVGPSKFTETFGECIKIKTAYDTAQKSTSESQQRHKSTKSTHEDYKQSKTYPKAKHQKQQPEFGKSNFHHQDKSECRVSKASKSHPEPRPPMESSQQSLFSTEVPKKISKPARSDVIMSSNPASPVLIDGEEFSTESESENPAVRQGKKILKEKKRIRNRKFTFHENLVLIENLVPHFHKLLGNRAAATESAWKNTIWKQIADAVTSVGVSPRSADNVRKRYQDIRLLLRRKISDENKSRKATGGGPEKKIVYHQYEELLRPYIDLDSIVGIKAGFDTSRHHENEQHNAAQHTYRQQKLSFMAKLTELLEAHLPSPGEQSHNARNLTSSNHSSFVCESIIENDAIDNFTIQDI
ncbi:uncharacterized protein LOC120936045 [Rana temporaria]|uniref:uncharacterized protein LOC120936045 n=1 Tax=Rana temporaria TaxID=8407 RepID=UPI001AAC9D74|nr:uncharacterized protein LOC120936045 [Rana temporaria]